MYLSPNEVWSVISVQSAYMVYLLHSIAGCGIIKNTTLSVQWSDQEDFVEIFLLDFDLEYVSSSREGK